MAHRRTGCRASSQINGVELRGFEPLTPTLPVWCATSCATAPDARTTVQGRGEWFCAWRRWVDPRGSRGGCGRGGQGAGCPVYSVGDVLGVLPVCVLPVRSERRRAGCG